MGGRSPKAGASIDIDAKLTEVDRGLQKVQSLYEQYFAGVQKREPSKEHQEFKTSLARITPVDLKTTAAKFRFQSIQSRYLQLSTLWTKIQRQIEEGTYKRDLFLLEKKTTGEQPRPANLSATNSATETPKAKKHLETLYEKMSALVGSTQKLPEKQTFLANMDKQLTDLKAKNPDKKIELKIQKSATGKVEVKIQLQQKK
ncbi:MAG: hypothetical protein J0L93_00290 [Deltaproteobacteria bacterium]|nr:hypothetical protein [Deltaproteobacteria bacterium]